MTEFIDKMHGEKTDGAGAAEVPVLSLSRIEKRFAGVHALKGVNLAVYPGEIVALIGENGAGKSTLMKVIGGVHQPDGGTIEVAGEPTQIRGVKDAIAAGISFIHQELNVLDNIDVAGNVFLGREPLVGGPLKLIDRAKMHRDTKPYLERLGLAMDTHTPLSELSLAQQQMVEIAKALSLKSRVLIMDEPTSSLTLTETERLIAVSKELRSQGVSIIYISHRLGEVKELADRVVGLRDGANAGGLDREEISHESMVRLMVGRDIARHKAAEEITGREVRLAVNGLKTRRYPNSAVSFEVHAGEILGFAGLVGAGRSEVAQSIFGVDRLLGGSMTLDGKPLRIASARDAIAQGIYLAPEDRKRSGLIIDISIRDNITLPALSSFATMGLVRRGDERNSAEISSKNLGVKTPSTDFLAKNLSGGNQQKVVLAKWLSLSPKVLIFDEPTRGIDVGAKSEIYELMRKLAGQGVAIMMISSDMEEVLGLSDRIAVMHEGRITGILGSADASEESVMNLAVGNLLATA